jgi:pimeloyl-ACP methyl ester carboxylesterase
MAAPLSPAFVEWRQSGKTFQYRGHPIFYRVEGEGPALLAIHGFPSASWDWHLVWRDLTERFRVVAPDMIGFGWSAKPRTYDYSMVDQASLMEALLGDLGVSRAHVLAHDYGDTVAQELLARHEDRRERGEPGLAIESVCFLNGGLFPETHRPRTAQRLLASPLGPLFGRLVTRRSFAAGMTAIFGRDTPPSAPFIDELWALLRHEQGQRVVHRLIAYMAERRRLRARWVGVLARTRVPLRVVNGTADPVSGGHMVARYRELVPRADVVELEAIGHYPQIEDPASVLRAFRAFHDEVVRAGAHSMS